MDLKDIFDSQVWQHINVARSLLEQAITNANALKHQDLAKQIYEVKERIITLQARCSKISKGE
jgi:hypothetical protein